MSRRVLLVVNRKARLGKAAHAQAVSELQALGFEVVDGCCHPDHRPADRIRELAGGVDFIVVGGGDGTLNATADAVLAAGKPLAILPLGTANDLARTLGLPTDISAACRLIAAGQTRRIDLGRVNGKPFFNVASVGLSVSVTDGLSKERKAQFGVFAYFLSAVEAVWRWRPFDVDITVDGVTHRGRSVQVSVGNGRHYGGGLTVSSDAAIDDQRLDVYSLEVRGWWQLLPLLPGLLNGTLAGSPRVRVFHGHRVEVRTRRRKRVNTDGELTTHTPATFEVVPRAVEVFVPAAGGELPQTIAGGTEEFPTERPLRRLLRWVGRHDLLTLFGALLVVVGLLAFSVLAAVVNGGGASFDDQLLRGLRTSADPAVPVGPPWLAKVVRDVTALGGYTVLTLVTLGVAGYLGLRRRWSAAVLVMAAAGGGAIICDGLKGAFARTRPAVVPHLDDVSTASFPSSHAAASAAVYLTLALMLARTVRRQVVRAYLLGWAFLLTGLVGFSRMYLGVHYPTDVLGGWAIGLSWALLCGLVGRWLRHTRLIG